MRKSVFRITGMSYASCAARIEKGIEKLAGVSSTVVNFTMEELIVSHDESFISGRRDRFCAFRPAIKYGVP